MNLESALHSSGDDAIRLPASESLQATLQDTFGIEQLRPGQDEVIASVLAGRNTLAIMPTGAGKSLCYQLPALHMPGTTVVVSPLISLMKDQVDKLDEAGIEATQVNSTLTERDEHETMNDIVGASSEFVFVTPERLTDAEFIAALKSNPIDLLVVDEAHCVSQWGHDFRPAFLNIGAAIEALGRPPVLALTATAKKEVIEDIARQLGLADLHIVDTGIFRPNLHYRVRHVTNEDEKRAQLLATVREHAGSGIVYTATVKAAEEVLDDLRQAGEAVVLYHGRLPVRERKANQDAFMGGDVRIMVATNAFGMGIDKPDIRFVVHYQIPGSLEAYYQESGRAGRDGQPAHCTLIYDLKDKRVQQFFLVRRYPETNDFVKIYAALSELSEQAEIVPLRPLHDEVKPMTLTKLRVALNLLKNAQIIGIEGENYRLLKREVAAEALAEVAHEYAERGERDHKILERMVFYAQTGFCRWKAMLDYFGKASRSSDCGMCDNCLQPPTRQLSPLRARRTERMPPPSSARFAFKEGEAVTVRKFGEGRVVSVAGDRVTIAFPNSEIKAFMGEYVKAAG